MSTTYQNLGPVDCTTPIDTAHLKGRTAIVTGGMDGSSIT
jgi:hypothetical protein